MALAFGVGDEVRVDVLAVEGALDERGQVLGLLLFRRHCSDSLLWRDKGSNPKNCHAESY